MEREGLMGTILIREAGGEEPTEPVAPLSHKGPPHEETTRGGRKRSGYWESLAHQLPEPSQRPGEVLVIPTSQIGDLGPQRGSDWAQVTWEEGTESR